MPTQPTEETLVSILNRLKAEGFTLDFNLEPECLACTGENIRLQPDDFEIVKTVRLEGMSDPDENLIVYAIESKDGQKGTLLTPYGVYADESAGSALATKLALHRN